MGVGDWPVGILCPGVPVKERTRKEKDVRPSLPLSFHPSSCLLLSFAVRFYVLVPPQYTCRASTRLFMNVPVSLCTMVFARKDVGADAENTLTRRTSPSYFFLPNPIPQSLFSQSVAKECTATTPLDEDCITTTGFI